MDYSMCDRHAYGGFPKCPFLQAGWFTLTCQLHRDVYYTKVNIKIAEGIIC